jgi:hypothetical protein
MIGGCAAQRRVHLNRHCNERSGEAIQSALAFSRWPNSVPPSAPFALSLSKPVLSLSKEACSL